MFKKLFSLCLLSFSLFAGCQKEDTLTTSPVSSELSGDKSTQDLVGLNSIVSTNHWYGSYIGVNPPYDPETGDPDVPPGFPDAVTDYSFIHNGVAQLSTIPPEYSFDFSFVSFDIPSQYYISGDSLSFVTVVENLKANSFSDYDVIVRIIGDKDSAEVHFVADPSFQSATDYYVGNARYTNIKSLVNYFGSFKTVKLIQKKYQTATYVNNVLAYKFSYGSQDSIGRVKTIRIGGKGFVTVNNVKLLNSYTNKTLMTEAFNTDGHSHTLFN